MAAVTTRLTNETGCAREAQRQLPVRRLCAVRRHIHALLDRVGTVYTRSPLSLCRWRRPWRRSLAPHAAVADLAGCQPAR